MSVKKAATPVERDPRLVPGTETATVTHGGSFVDGQLAHETLPRAAAAKADRGGKEV